MAMPFSQRVAEATWLDEATTWITERVHADGHRLTGAIEQPRIRPWSTQLVVPTDVGRWWFKANCRSLAFEPGLHAALSELVPAAVDRPRAIDAERGWLLTADHGQTLHERGEPTAEDWHGIVAENARLQATLAPHRDRLVGLGLPDCAPSTTLDRFDRLIALYSDLPDQHPAHVPPELQVRLQSARPGLVDAVDQLSASPLPTTWQHGDLHPGNTFTSPDGPGRVRMRLFDFGDSQWAHALESLVVPFGWITSLSQLAWDPLLEAYAEAWEVEVGVLHDEWWAAGMTHAVNRSLTWWGCLAEATAEQWREWGDSPIAHLSRVLDR